MEGDRTSTGAHAADVLLTFVRTDPQAAQHEGISALLTPTDTPGVTCRPFASASDHQDLDFNEVFFTDVRVSAENLVGPLNVGWLVATGSCLLARLPATFVLRPTICLRGRQKGS